MSENKTDNSKENEQDKDNDLDEPSKCQTCGGFNNTETINWLDCPDC